jgi:acyl-coenzyme A synthetase/AMP-(fatty) acid ligase/acyl carrier protein
VTTLSFDIAVLELLLPPLCGARVTVADAETAMDANALRRLLQNVGATAMQATPATWRALVTSGGVPETVRLRLCGGEALPRDLAADLLTDGAELWNVYGPTETTVWSAAGRVSPNDPVRVGPPIPGTRMYVLDEALRPVPVGVTGQVFLGGAGVTRGYHGKPSLTAQRFVPDPYSTCGERLYATGDLGRWDPDGRIELLGRMDHQIKLRGFRIEIEEIETALRSCAGVTDAAVALVTEPEPRLVAYVVGPTEDLAGQLTRRLPEYMVPSLFEPLDRLPRTPNGKLDRAALPAPSLRAPTPSRAPQTATEIELAQVWQDVLKLDQTPGVEDNFFVLGGHSLTAIALLARVRDAVGVEIALRELFNRPTIAGLVEALEAARAHGSSVPQQPPQRWPEDMDDKELDDLLRELLS